MGAPIATSGPALRRIAIVLAGRAALLATSLVAVATAVQLLLWAAPGDPIDLLPNGEELREQLSAEWGLDQPIAMRVVTYLMQAARGNLGTSLAYRPGTPVIDVLWQPALTSLGLLVGAVVLSLAWGTALAVWTRGQRRRAQRLVRAFSVAPVFLLAHIGVHGINEVTFALIEAGSIARPEWFALPSEASLMRSTLAVMLLAVGSGSLAEIHQEVEQALLSIRRSGFVDAARARGEPTFLLIARHLLIPVASLAAARTGFLLGGLVILEKVLLINGAGAILWQAALLRDVPVALGITLFSASTVCLARLAADTVRVGLDPRLRGRSA